MSSLSDIGNSIDRLYAQFVGRDFSNIAGGLLILVCGTCLDHFDLLGRKQVGETTNMLDVVTAMQLADKVINI